MRPPPIVALANAVDERHLLYLRCPEGQRGLR
jgi:hypothetical protein